MSNTLPQAPSSEINRNNELFNYYSNNTEYLKLFSNRHFLTDRFLKKYYQSLFYYKHFYDDLNEYGNISTCNDVFYFIPGFNGTPGQIKFGIPSILKVFGNDVYIKSLYVEEFSCKYPTWLKYTKETLEKKRTQIIKDIHQLSQSGKKIRIVVSSSGFYDFLATYPELMKYENNLILYWISCAPDKVSESPWEKAFFPFNGFTFKGHNWFAYPNIQAIKFLNPECGSFKKWHWDGQKNHFGKNDLESRFYQFGFMWDYVSPSFFNEVLKLNLDVFHELKQKVKIETHVLAATDDGFWDDSSEENISATLSRYIASPKILFKKTSHLWVVTPEHLTHLFLSASSC